MKKTRDRRLFEPQENRRGHTPLPPTERVKMILTTTLLSFTYITATPMSRQPLLLDWNSGYLLTTEGFAYLWSGACASYGVRKVCVYLEMNINGEISMKHFSSVEPNLHVVYRLAPGLLLAVPS